MFRQLHFVQSSYFYFKINDRVWFSNEGSWGDERDHVHLGPRRDRSLYVLFKLLNSPEPPFSFSSPNLNSSPSPRSGPKSGPVPSTTWLGPAAQRFTHAQKRPRCSARRVLSCHLDTGSVTGKPEPSICVEPVILI